jgi:hypothetical protein
MSKLTAQQLVEKQIRNTKAAITDYKEGVNRVQVAPGVQAAKKKDKMQMNLNAALDSGKWERNVASVSLEEWKTQASNKGANRIGAGLDGSRDKSIAVFEKILAYQDRVVAEISAMPDLTPEDREQRALVMMRRMRQFQK